MIERVCEPNGNSTHGPQRRGVGDLDARRGEHDQLLLSESGGLDTGDVGRRFDADDEIEFAVDQVVDQLARRGDAQEQGHVGSVGTELLQRVGQVDQGGRIDHPDADPAGDSRALAVGPRRQIAGEPQHLTGVGDDGSGSVADVPAPSVPVEQRDAEPPFELGEALRERRRADADRVARPGPRRRLVDGHEVLQLADREVRKRAHLLQNSSDLLHRIAGV